VRDERGGVLPGGDVGGDAQLDESFSLRFHHRDRPGATVIYCYYATLDLDDLTTIYIEQQTEQLVSTDPADPGSTKEWSACQPQRPRRLTTPDHFPNHAPSSRWGTRVRVRSALCCS
jgi:hypothetical protein